MLKNSKLAFHFQLDLRNGFEKLTSDCGVRPIVRGAKPGMIFLNPRGGRGNNPLTVKVLIRKEAGVQTILS